MYKVTFTGFETLEQAEAFAQWYSGSGEQESGMWLEEYVNVKAAHVASINTFKEEKLVVVPLNLYYV